MSLTRCSLASLLLSSVAAMPTVAQERPYPSGDQPQVAVVVADADALAAGFRQPPADARPRTWWHWLNGNVSEEGIKADLDWMHRMGIGGVHYFDAGPLFAPTQPVVEKRVVVGDERWRSAVALAGRIADRDGMEFATAASPGWSITGGPWVTPAQAMKKYVWSESVIEGGRHFDGRLATPPSSTGAFQDVPGAGVKRGSFYADALVVAYRQSPEETSDRAPVSATTPNGSLDLAKLVDGNYGAAQDVIGGPDGTSPVVVIGYARPVTIRGILLGVAGRAASEWANKPTIELSDDGRTWRGGVTLSGPGDAVVKSYAFAPLTARFFKVSLGIDPPPPAYDIMAPRRGSGAVKIALTELRLVAAGTVDRFAEKAGFSEPIRYEEAPTAAVGAGAVIGRGDVVDLTERMKPDGSLDWTPPKGRWRVIRLGYSLTGRENSPAPPEATGLEVDKFSPKHIRAYLDAYLGRFEAALGRDMIGAHGLRNLMADSWEAGTQNWTDDMRAEFRARRGYDLAPWLPVLTGRVVESATASDAFLYDFRRTLQDLLAQHYEVLRSELHKRGMGLYAEAQGDNWRAIADGLEVKSRADIPMAEYWYRPFAAGPGQPSLKMDMKEAASAAHLYGKPLIANESLTVATSTPWAYAPADLKPVVDEIFAYGINRFVLHTSVHQPVIGKVPGLAMGPFGQYLNRNETWAEQAKPFFDYVARSSYLLQQGRYVADVAYFYGERRPLVSLAAGRYDKERDRFLIEVPQGHGYDFINAETLRMAADAADGHLTTRGGMRYRILYLGPDASAMTLPTMRRLAELVDKGIVLVGKRPTERLGREGSDAEFAALASTIWGKTAASGRVGAGRVYADGDLSAALRTERITPDVEASGNDPNLLSLHRRLGSGEDLYYLVNRDDAPIGQISFRTSGLVPERWDAATGTARPLSYRREGGRSVVRVDLAPHDATFVVFRRVAGAPSRIVPAPHRADLLTLAGPWTVAFQPERGAPPRAVLPQLASWSDNADPGVRYFSGTATYTRDLNVAKDWLRAGQRIYLDLGEVREVAQVLVNGQDGGIAWKPPYRVDVTRALRPGRNKVEIRVTNLWPNRLIGDQQPGAAKVTWTPSSPLFRKNQWQADGKLLPSGLLGPVRLQTEDNSTLRATDGTVH